MSNPPSGSSMSEEDASMPRMISLRIAGPLSLASTLVIMTFLILFGVLFVVNGKPSHAFAFVAAAAEMAALLELAHLTWTLNTPVSMFPGDFDMSCQSGPTRLAISLSLSTLAALASIGSFGWMLADRSNIPSTNPGERVWMALMCAFGSWGLAMLSRALVYCCLFRLRSHSTTADSSPLASQTAMRTSLYNLDSVGMGQKTIQISRVENLPPDVAIHSARSSLTISVLPSSSHTKLLPLRNSTHSYVSTSYSQQSQHSLESSTSSDLPGLPSAPHSIRESLFRPSPSARGLLSSLSPIPGSRPASPARALDGPFPASLPPSEPSTPTTPRLPFFSRSMHASTQNPLPTLAMAPTSHPCTMSRSATPSMDCIAAVRLSRSTRGPTNASTIRHATSTDSLDSAFPHALVALRNHPLTSSRPPTSSSAVIPAVISGSPTSEAHIHPLFRPSSPTPPPTAMPGTVVTAFPGNFDDYRIDEAMLGEMRNRSRSFVRSGASSRTSSWERRTQNPVMGLGVMMGLSEVDGERERTPGSPLAAGEVTFDDDVEAEIDQAKTGHDGEEAIINEYSQNGTGDQDDANQDEVSEQVKRQIPDWILSAGKRRSLLGYGKRKSEAGTQDEEND